MTSWQKVIMTVLQRAGTSPRSAVNLAVQLACDNQCQRETAEALAEFPGMAPAWARAALIERIDGPAAAAALWKHVVTDSGCEVPEALLGRARAAAQQDKLREAVSLLQLALHCGPDFGFFTRAEVLVRKCKTESATRRRARIALLGSSTTSLLRSVIELLCFRDGIESAIYEQPFGAYGQELLQDNSGLYGFAPDFVVLLLNWRDLGLSPHNSEACVHSAVARLTLLWQAALKGTSATLIQCLFVPPSADPYHGLSSALPSGRARAIRKINEKMLEAAPERVLLLDCERLAAIHQDVWEDPLQWSAAKLYPAPSALPLLGEHLVSYIRAELGLSRKLLAVDLDNTLWGGVVGEDGIGGIRLGPPSAEGERFQALQQYLKDLKNRGILLAVVSKNNPRDATDVFRNHQATVLRLEDFVAFKANWNDKAQNIRELADELRLGLDSIVFLDDNPGERNAVRRALPDVLVPEITGEPSETIAILERGLYSQAAHLTSEDTARGESYLASARQEELRSRFTGIDEFLVELQMRMEHGAVDEHTVLRVTQLINKTNQFNLTSKRYTQDEVRQAMRSPRWWFRWYRLRDRYADHGLIAVLLARIGAEWDVDLWLMSCRVIGRGVEDFVFRDLVTAAKNSGASRIRAHFIPSGKNQPAKDLLPRLGFVPVTGTTDYTLDVDSALLPTCKFLTETAQFEATAS
jgi:FkbH-like protein